MGDPNVYLDETNMRMTMNFRNNFVSTCRCSYHGKDQFEKAEKVY